MNIITVIFLRLSKIAYTKFSAVPPPYAGYMAVLGSKPELYPDSPYVDRYITGSYQDYCISPEECSSSAVAAVILLLVIMAGGAVFVVKLLRRKEKTPSRPLKDDDEAYVVEDAEEVT